MVTGSLKPVVVVGDPPRKYWFICLIQKELGSLFDPLPGLSPPPFISSHLGPAWNTE